MTKDEPKMYCCGRLMRPAKRPTSDAFKFMWICDECKHRQGMSQKERIYYQKLL